MPMFALFYCSGFKAKDEILVVIHLFKICFFFCKSIWFNIHFAIGNVLCFHVRILFGCSLYIVVWFHTFLF